MSLIDDPKDLQDSNIRRRSRARFQCNEVLRDRQCRLGFQGYRQHWIKIKFGVPEGSMKREPNLSLIYTHHVKYFLDIIRTISHYHIIHVRQLESYSDCEVVKLPFFKDDPCCVRWHWCKPPMARSSQTCTRPPKTIKMLQVEATSAVQNAQVPKDTKRNFYKLEANWKACKSMPLCLRTSCCLFHRAIHFSLDLNMFTL